MDTALERAVRPSEWYREIAEQYHSLYPWADVDTLEINLRLAGASRARHQAWERTLAEQGLPTSSGRYSVVCTLYLKGDTQLPLNDISKRLGVTPGTLTSLVDGLVKDGIVQRVTSETDRRVGYLKLTEEGRRSAETAVPSIARMSMDICEGLSSRQKVQFLKLLRHVETRALAQID